MPDSVTDNLSVSSALGHGEFKCHLVQRREWRGRNLGEGPGMLMDADAAISSHPCPILVVRSPVGGNCQLSFQGTCFLEVSQKCCLVTDGQVPQSFSPQCHHTPGLLPAPLIDLKPLYALSSNLDLFLHKTISYALLIASPQ